VIVLALETATIEVGAALVGPDGVLAEWHQPCRRRHAETLHPAVGSVLAAAGVGLGELDAVAVDVGPGLFTGLRVGVAAAKAFGFALGIPLVAVRSTEVLAAAGAADPRAAGVAVVPVVDMRRGELAWELPGSALEIGPATQLADRLAGLAGPVFVVGDGAARLAAVGGLPGVVFAGGDESLAAPSVAVLGGIGLERAEQGATVDAVSIEPCYLRAADARASFETRDRDPAAGCS
jgi:tRNA threonylcarbamoyladenosine biosynthesis protein TsaB